MADLSEYFPTDVRVRLDGDIGDARTLVGPTRRLLFLALLMQDRYGDGRPVGLEQRLSALAVARVFLHNGQKIVTITAERIEGTPEIPTFTPEIPTVEVVVPGTIFMLHGWLKRGVVVASATPGGANLLDSYYPTAGSQLAWGVPGGFNKNEKLAIDVVGVKTSAVTSPISDFTGTMRKVLAAVYGVGIITNSEPSYVDGTVPSPAKHGVVAHYFTDWTRSQGIYKAGTKNHWIVEIGQRGIHAMPLPLFEASKGTDFRNATLRKGDVDTVRVLDEFGGIPTGETIPSSDTALDNAVSAGKVLRLRTAGDMQTMYTGAFSACNAWGWAFNASGSEAHNTCLRLVSRTGVTWTSISAPPAGKGYWLWGEHWRVTLTLSTHNVNNLNLVPPQPIGSGTATLARMGRGTLPIGGALDWMWVAEGGVMKRPLAISRLPTFAEADRNAFATYSNSNAGPNVKTGETGITGATVFVYFDNERLKRVKWVPGFVHTESIVRQNASTKYTESPPAFVSEDFDNRIVNVGGGAIDKIGPAATSIHNANGGIDYTLPVVTDLNPVGNKSTFNEFLQVVGVREGWVSINYASLVTSSRYTKWTQQFQWNTHADGYTFYELTWVEGTWAASYPDTGDRSYQSFEDVVTVFRDSVVGMFANGERVNFGWRPRDSAGVNTWPTSGTVLFDGAVNPGPTGGYSFTDGPYQTGSGKPKPYVIRHRMPNGMEPYLPHETGWVGSV